MMMVTSKAFNNAVYCHKLDITSVVWDENTMKNCK